MTTERAGHDAYLCRWGCGKGQSPGPAGGVDRYYHEIDVHGATYTGALAAEVDKLRTEADALRTALAKLRESAINALERLGDGNSDTASRVLRPALAAADAALRGAAK